jgi:formylglycine-generating enzyme required for sulfatase activity
MGHDVFISYSTKNATVADAVCAGLERRGIRCWIAPRDIEPGQDWPSAIIEAIDACKVFVIIVSSASNLSDDVLRELQNAASNGVPIIPLRIEDIVLTPRMRYFLGTPQWLDALTEPLEQHVGRLGDTVGGLLGRVVGAGAQQVATLETGAEQVTQGAGARVEGVRIGTPSGGAAGPATVGLPRPVREDRAWERSGCAVGEEIVGPDGGVYVWVPPGSFMMGSDDGEEREKPVHGVQLAGFWLGKYQVTNAQYRAFCDATGRRFPEKSDQGACHPVVFVSWHDGRDYCQHYGLSLPTEAQWEYAAAGPEGRRYPWGEEWAPEKLCWKQNGGPGGRTFAVGRFTAGASWCSALDMAGNVWEWCADWYAGDYYGAGPEFDPPGPESGYARVLRGGSWDDGGPVTSYTAYRFSHPPDFALYHLGFRALVRIVW